MVFRPGALILAALGAALAVAIAGGVSGLADVDWQVCLDQSDGSHPELLRVSDRPLAEQARLVLHHMAETPWTALRSTRQLSLALILLALVYLPPLLLALPAALAQSGRTRICFGLALVALVATEVVLLLPPEHWHQCDRKGPQTFAIFVFAPFIALVFAGGAIALRAIWGRNAR
ncbi:MAG: hypothetical protein AB7U46_11830 [Paenirhodobacter sp.]|uniref:hypothetical protein n=1 Tax=Paenirhodobacter sp. TaxID=1965326 RepID=UPI003D1166F8